MQSSVRKGTVIAGFRVDSLIGEGAMGAVYLAEEVATGRRVALKLLAPELARVAAAHRGDAGGLARGLLGIRAVFGEDLSRDPRFTETVTAWLAALLAQGAARTVAGAGRVR